MKFSTLYPEINTMRLDTNTRDIFISGNNAGSWILQDGTNVSSSTFSYQTIIFDYFGLYQFYVNNWDGDEVCVIQLTIVPEG